MATQKKSGNNHVIYVKNALENYLRGELPNEHPAAVKTAEFILASHSNIERVRSKFDFQNSDSHSDLTLYLKTGDEIKINLFLVSGNAGIQPKNVGAKSFISKYFLNENLQEKFNELLEIDYNQFLVDLFEYKTGVPTTITSRDELTKIDPIWRFNDEEINEIRERFLFSLRENCFSLFQDFCNSNPSFIENAFNTMLMVNDFNIITRVHRGQKVRVEEFKPKLGLSFTDIKLFKSGDHTVSILCGSACLNLRFKLESGPLSSIKLAIGHKYISNLNTFDKCNHNVNLATLKQSKLILSNTEFVEKDNKSNAIGKCNEALVYLQLLNKFPNTIQVDPQYCLNLLKTYAPYVAPEEIEKLQLTSIPTVEQIIEKIATKYPTFSLESIQLVPESYVKDKLDTSDLELNLRYRNTRITEKLSLKAISNEKKVTLKNPGIGTILGVNFFNARKEDNEELNKTVALVKEKYSQNQYTHMKCLEDVSQKLGELLQNASQEQLRQGIESILGKPLVITSVYNETIAYVHERQPVLGEVKVNTQSPSAIQTTLTWENGKSELSLRVKYSKGQDHGWSSLKLAVEQKIQREA